MTRRTLTVAAIEVKNGIAEVILSDGTVLAGLHSIATGSDHFAQVTEVTISLSLHRAGRSPEKS